MKKANKLIEQNEALALYILNNVVTVTYLWSELEAFDKVYKVSEVDFLITDCLEVLGYS